MNYSTQSCCKKTNRLQFVILFWTVRCPKKAPYGYDIKVVTHFTLHYNVCHILCLHLMQTCYSWGKRGMACEGSIFQIWT